MLMKFFCQIKQTLTFEQCASLGNKKEEEIKGPEMLIR